MIQAGVLYVRRCRAVAGTSATLTYTSCSTAGLYLPALGTCPSVTDRATTVTAAATTDTHMRTATITLPVDVDDVAGHVTRELDGASEVKGDNGHLHRLTFLLLLSNDEVDRRSASAITQSTALQCKDRRSTGSVDQSVDPVYISYGSASRSTRHAVMAFNPAALPSSLLLRRDCAKSFPDRR